jgi:cytochrome c-type biogenesis protein CcmH
MSIRFVLLVLAWLASPSMAALAVQPDEILSDPALEGRARALSRELRCMVCQNQSIDDSDAPLARDLRILVRDRLKAGDSDRQVLDFLTARYGDFVLLKPRFGWDTAALWLAPAAVLLIGACGLVVMMGRRRRVPGGGGGNTELTEPQLSAAERARLTELLGQSEQSTGQPS